MYVRLYLNVKRADAGAVEHRRAKQVTKKKLDICGRVNFVLKSTVLLFVAYRRELTDFFFGNSLRNKRCCKTT